MNRSQTDAPLVIGPSEIKLLGTLGVGALGMILGASLLIVSWWGVGALLWWGWYYIVAIALLGVVNLIIALVRHRPRLEIDAEGFSVLPIFGGHSRRWTDIDGDFAVIKCGFGRAVAYRLTPAYKSEIGFKPTTLYEGYDGAIMGAFALSIPELAALLNEHKRRAVG